jgi:hypothetical protein
MRRGEAQPARARRGAAGRDRGWRSRTQGGWCEHHGAAGIGEGRGRPASSEQGGAVKGRVHGSMATAGDGGARDAVGAGELTAVWPRHV